MGVHAAYGFVPGDLYLGSGLFFKHAVDMVAGN